MLSYNGQTCQNTSDSYGTLAGYQLFRIVSYVSSLRLGSKANSYSVWCFVRKYFASVHHFTTLELEIQATGFSYGDDSVIKYLCLTPQVNTVGNIVSREDRPTELDAVKEFAAMDSGMIIECDIRSRCWIHTHPKFKAFMSAVDLCQLFMLRLSHSNSFIRRSSFTQGTRTKGTSRTPH